VLTVVCWKWNGWRNIYTAEHVNVLHEMLKDNLSIPHRLVCVTDDPAGIKCETVPIWDEPKVETGPNVPNCFRRLWLFSEEAKDVFGDQVLSIDLDCLIVNDIAPLITGDDFKIVRGVSSPYNGSMWLHRPGTRPHVWQDFDPETVFQTLKQTQRADGKSYYGSDQAWMSFALPDEPTWGESDGVYHFQHLEPRQKWPKNARIIFFAGARKPWHYSLKTWANDIFSKYRYYRQRVNEDYS
jgi:hypothetical protein